MFISEKLDFKTKAIRDKDGHYIMIKGTMQQKDITLLKIQAPNIEATQYGMKIFIDIKGGIKRNTVILGNF